MASTAQRPKLSNRIVIIGAGVFGLSTALELSKRGYVNVTVLDRYLPPVPDGSSVDISRVIRPDYADDFYARLGLEAMEGWTNEYRSFFHRSGLLCTTQGKDFSYLQSSKNNLHKLGKRPIEVVGNQARVHFPAIHGDLSNINGYFNPDCGWADAEGSIRHMASLCASNGVSFQTGKKGTVTGLIINDRKVVGVRTESRESVHCDLIIVATGAWTPHLLNMTNVSVSDAQPVGFIQLSADEAKELAGLPVMIDMSTGWFAFPPTPNTHVLKMARHGYGFEIMRASLAQQAIVSVPALNKDNAASTFIPEDAERALRDGLALFLPKFKDRAFMRQRLCWYTDTPKGDFIVDYHPAYDNLFVATGGSGHAFKFLPIIGHYISDAIELQASEEQRLKWAWRPSSENISKGDGSRGGPPRRVLSHSEQARL